MLNCDPEIPDLIEPLIGWRWWTVSEHGLYSPISPYKWIPNKRAVASCRSYSCSKIPNSKISNSSSNHNCGFHAMKTREQLLNYAYTFASPYLEGEANSISGIFGFDFFGLMGEVKLWGSIIEGAKGYRAQYAYPASFYITEKGYNRHGSYLEQFDCSIIVGNWRSEVGNWRSEMIKKSCP